MKAPDRDREGRGKDRTVYGLIFATVVYGGMAFMATLGWTAFVDELILPRAALADEGARTERSSAEAGRSMSREPSGFTVDDLPPVPRSLYRFGHRVRGPGLFWMILILPIGIGILFECWVLHPRVKIITYYLVSAAMGLAILVLAILAILEVMPLVPAGSGG